MPSESKSTEEIEVVEIAGTAIFKKNKMIAMLSPEETQGFSWVFNYAENTLVTIAESEQIKTYVSVETKNMKAKIKTSIVDGKPEVTIKLTGCGDIVEEDGSTNNGISEMKRNVAELVNKKIENEIKASLEIIQKKYESDVLNIARIIHIQHEKDWESGMDDNWGEIFPEIPFEISVDINIRSSVIKQQPMNIE
jgi:spore germination protein KC